MKQRLLREVKAMMKDLKIDTVNDIVTTTSSSTNSSTNSSSTSSSISSSSLSKLKMRAREYAQQIPLFENSLNMIKIDPVVGDPFAGRDSFKSLGKLASIDVDELERQSFST